MKVYEKVKAYVDNHGLDYSSVAKSAGIPADEFAGIMAGKSSMSIDDLRSICVALNVCPENFIEYKIA